MAIGELIINFIDFYTNLDLESIILDISTGQNKPRVTRPEKKKGQIWLGDAYSPSVIHTTQQLSSIQMLRLALSRARGYMVINKILPSDYFDLMHNSDFLLRNN